MSRPPSAVQFHQKSKTLNDKYLLGDEIGKGAYGRVYKGLDLENGDFVAIKQVSLENIFSEDLASIMQEIDLLKNLNHKNIVKYLGSFKNKSYLYIILEYVENGSLASIIKPNKFGAFPESLVAVYIAQVLEGLVYLHEQGVIHRDIKGANILTTKEVDLLELEATAMQRRQPNTAIDTVRDEQEELYRQPHRELESIDRRVTRARTRSLGSSTSLALLTSTSHTRTSTSGGRGARPRGRAAAARGSGRSDQMPRVPEEGLDMSIPTEEAPHIDLLDVDIPVGREPIYDSDGNTLTDGDYSSTSSSGFDEDY